MILLDRLSTKALQFLNLCLESENGRDQILHRLPALRRKRVRWIERISQEAVGRESALQPDQEKAGQVSGGHSIVVGWIPEPYCSTPVRKRMPGSANELLRLHADSPGTSVFSPSVSRTYSTFTATNTTTVMGAAKMTVIGPNKRMSATMPRIMTAGGMNTRRLWINGVNKLPSIW
jgi:hypothetical protein